MTEKELKQYKALCRFEARKAAELEAYEGKEVTVVAGKVKGSMSRHPYIEVRTSVLMEDPKEADHYKAKADKCRAELVAAQERIMAIESFIEGISDARTKAVFDMRVYENKSWYDIAEEMDEGKGRKTYSRLFFEFIKS